MRTVIIYNDTLRRQNLKAYNNQTDTIAPNIEAFSQDSITFDNHYCGSMPCMPARRDLFTGKLNFLERSWGPIEISDTTFPKILSENHIRSHIITDHAHYFRIGGENYCQQFDSYEFFRGQESDPWVSLVDDPYTPKDYYGVVKRQYQSNKTRLKEEKDFPSVKCFDEAMSWVDSNQGADDFLLMVETFDPHEPFDVPKEYLDLYQDEYEGPHFDLPLYAKRSNETDEAVNHLRTRYKALITMLDVQLGKFIRKLKDADMYEDTLIILTTDHGYCLGERDFFGKSYMPYYNELVNIPLFIHMPNGQYKGTRRSGITQNIDMMPTLMDYYGLETPKSVTGKSLMNLIHYNQSDKEYALFGCFGLSVNIFDGQHTYFRGPRNNNCFEYTTSLTTIRDWLGKDQSEEIECGNFLGNVNFPVYKVPARFNPICNDPKYLREDMLFNIHTDYGQTKNIQDKELRKEMKVKLMEAMKEHQAPIEQYDRLGLE